MRFLLFSGLFLMLVSCNLTATQEQNLNEQTGRYLNALKSKSVLAIVALTYPPYVKHIQSQGDEYFKKSFSVKPWESELEFTQSKIQEIKSEGKSIHVHYLVEKEYIYDDDEFKNSPYEFVAISEDDGSHWFFLKYRVYRDKNICKELKRLIK